MEYRPRVDTGPADDSIVEVRVHGVGGATPESLLDVPHTVQVAGDPAAGFFRVWGAEGRFPTLEGYSWGGLTSAARLRALWALLAPFALANLAGWMLRHGGSSGMEGTRERSALESVGVGLVRFFGLVLTIAVVAYVAVGALDLVAFQCALGSTCAVGRWWLSPFTNRFVAEHAGRTLAVGMLVPLVVVLGLGWSARATQVANHRQLGAERFRGSKDPSLTLGLRNRLIWMMPSVAHRLALIHLAGAVGCIGLTAASIGTASGVLPGADWLAATGWTVLALAGVASLWLEGVSGRVHALLAGVAVVQFAVVFGFLWSTSEGRPIAAESAPGSLVILGVLLGVYLTVVLVVAVVVWLLWQRHRSGRMRSAMVSPALLLVGAGMVNAFGAGSLIRLADLLGAPVAAGTELEGALTQPPIRYPAELGDVAVLSVFAVLVLVVVTAVVVARHVRTGPSCAELSSQYAERGGLDCDDPDDRVWAESVSRAHAIAKVTDRVAAILGLTAAVVLVGTALLVQLSPESGLDLGSFADTLAGPASAIVGFIPLVVMYAISRLYRSRDLRRSVGVLWDVATFWPRWFHPWCPPSYGERAVLQLEDRLAVLTDESEVVLSGHSQGSVLAVSTVAMMEGDVGRRVSLLTHGSPLDRLYATFFPDYFGPELFGDVSDRAAGWINLWRPTDYIGGAVPYGDIDNRQLFDPPSSRVQARGEPRPRPARHNDYDRTPEYSEALEDLIGRPFQPDRRSII